MSLVISDTSPLHYLVQCGAVGILPALFGEVLVPPTVFRELQHPRTPPAVRAWAEIVPAWLLVSSKRPRHGVSSIFPPPSSACGRQMRDWTRNWSEPPSNGTGSKVRIVAPG